MDRTISPPPALNGTLDLPSDKSISHRSVMFASLHDGSSEISNFSEAADPESTVQCMRKLGVSVEQEGDTLRVEGVGRSGLQAPGEPLYCGNSGTTMRLVSGIIGGAGITATLTGDNSLSSRTMKRIIDPLREMGIQIDARENDFAPLSIRRERPLEAIEFPLPIPSAQLKSSVLLAGLFGEHATRVIETIPSRDHTERLLELPVEKGGEGERIITGSRSHHIPHQTYRVPNDFSAASFWLVAGSIHSEATVRMNGVGVNPTRTALLNHLQQMGARIRVENERMEGREPVADFTVQSGKLGPAGIGPGEIPNCIDEIPILSVAMLFADGVSEIRGAGELRHKETDRLAAIAAFLKASGARFTEYEDGFKIYGNPDFKPSPAVYRSFDDHRIAMAAAVLALTGSGPGKIQNAECTAISYPGFWADLEMLTN